MGYSDRDFTISNRTTERRRRAGPGASTIGKTFLDYIPISRPKIYGGMLFAIVFLASQTSGPTAPAKMLMGKMPEKL